MDIPTLSLLWFIAIALLWIGYLVLEGFDFGVGMLMRPVSRSDTERRLFINTIGPVWDGNEVWLLVAGGATFAAFPEWYATMFSGFYLPLLLILAALIVRGVAFEFRGKINDDTWRNRWDWCITIGSWLPAVLWGVAFANLIRGVELTPEHQMVSGFFDLLSPFALLGGAVTALLFATHGAIFVALKTAGEMRERTGRLAAVLVLPTLVAAGVWLIWAQLAYSAHTWTWLPVAVGAVALVATVFLTRARREGWAFLATCVAIASAVVFIFGALYPNVMPAINDPANSLTIANATSTPYTLTIMTWVAACALPFVIGYQIWSYWVFRKRLKITDIPENGGLPRTEPDPEPASTEVP